MEKVNFWQIFQVVEYTYSNDFVFKIPVKLFSQFSLEIPEIVLPYSISILTGWEENKILFSEHKKLKLKDTARKFKHSTSHLHYYKHNAPFIQVENGEYKNI